MTAAGIPAQLLDLLAVFLLAAGVGVFVAKVGRFPYTIALLVAGLAASVLGVHPGIPISHDLILFVLLPPILFEGAANTELERFRRNLVPIAAMAVVGLLVSVVVLALLGAQALGVSLLVATLFAVMILPTDPVSVLALFDELGAPDQLSVLVEGESLINDGVGVVLFMVVVDLVVRVQTGELAADAVFTLSRLWHVATEIVVVSLGGLVVGFLAGYATYRVMYNLDEPMTETVLSLLLAYGSFLIAEHYLHVSGVIATVVAGLFIGARGAEEAMSPQTKITVFNTLDTAAFLANTFIFLMIGITTPVRDLATHAPVIAVAIPLVLLARAAGLYPTIAVVNRLTDNDVSLDYQHIMVWGGLHASIPIALVLGLPAGIPPAIRQQLRALVFGVAAFSLLVQGLSMGRVLDRFGVVTRAESQTLYELLVGRRRAVDAALDAANDLKRRGDIPASVYDDFTTEYENELDDLSEAIAELLRTHPEIRQELQLAGERRLLTQEKSAVMDAMREGIVSDDAGERLLEEVNLKLDQIEDGETTVGGEDEEYHEFWRERAREFGLESIGTEDAKAESTDEENSEDASDRDGEDANDRGAADTNDQNGKDANE